MMVFQKAKLLLPILSMLLGFLIAFPHASAQCLRYAEWYPSILSTTNPGVFDVRFEMEIKAFGIAYEDNNFGFITSERDTITTNNGLSSYMDCISDFSFMCGDCKYEVRDISLSRDPIGPLNQNFHLIRNLDQDDDFLMVDSQGVYRLRLCNKALFVPFRADVLERQPLFVTRETVVSEYDPTAQLMVASDVVFDTVMEQRVVRAAYDMYTLEPPLLDTITAYYVKEERTTCPQATYTTKWIDIVTRDEFLIYDTTGSRWTDQLDYYIYQPGYVGRDAYHAGPTGLRRIKNTRIFDKAEILHAANKTSVAFFHDMEVKISKDTFPAIDTLIYKYDVCDRGYTRYGIWCVSEDNFVQDRVRTRFYKALETRASIYSTKTNAVTKRVRSRVITNKNILPTYCKIDSFLEPYEKIAKIRDGRNEYQLVPQITEPVEVLRYKSGTSTVDFIKPPENKTIVYETYIGGGLLIKNKTINPIPIISQEIYKLMASKLQSLGYLPSGVDPSSSEIMTATAIFQMDHGLSVGVIDQDLFNYLNISF